LHKTAQTNNDQQFNPPESHAVGMDLESRIHCSDVRIVHGRELDCMAEWNEGGNVPRHANVQADANKPYALLKRQASRVRGKSSHCSRYDELEIEGWQPRKVC
jgi:hypothetical protein